jgi:hypothetical protein
VVIAGPSQKIQARSYSTPGYGIFAKEAIVAGELI